MFDNLSCPGAVPFTEVTYAMAIEIDERDCGKKPIEFHFQEIFRGERIDIMTGDEILAQVTAKTRFQTGLAHIETLELCDGEEVRLEIRELDLKASLEVDVTRPYVTVNLIDGQLRVETTTVSPGYL